MKRILLALATGAVAATCALTGTAAASGPAPPGKEVVELQCEGLGPVTVSVSRSESGKGVGQIVGQKGHGIPVSFTFTLTDLSSGEVIVSETEPKGGGHAHPNQSTTMCKGTSFEGEAASIFGEELPPEVKPGDFVRGEFEVQVIIKR
jgi:hypothetical protein